jgi:hypothetical protein
MRIPGDRMELLRFKARYAEAEFDPTESKFHRHS